MFSYLYVLYTYVGKNQPVKKKQEICILHHILLVNIWITFRNTDPVNFHPHVRHCLFGDTYNHYAVHKTYILGYT